MEALRWFRRGASETELQEEFNELEKEMDKEGAKTLGVGQVFSEARLWKPVAVGMGVNLSMQFSGIDAVFYYSTQVFQDAGFPLSDAQVFTTLVGLVNVFVTIGAMFIMDKAGRKTIQSVGLGGMCISHSVMTYAMVNDHHMLAVWAMVSIIIFFGFGPGCIAWFIIPELVPFDARAIATALGLGVNWAANWFVAFIFPKLLEWVGKWTFSVFILSTFVLTVFTQVCVPETKGKSVTEVAKYFGGEKTEPLLA